MAEVNALSLVPPGARYPREVWDEWSGPQPHVPATRRGTFILGRADFLRCPPTSSAVNSALSDNAELVRPGMAESGSCPDKDGA